MKPTIIIAATVAAFVTAANKALDASDVPLVLKDLDHQDGRVAAVFESDLTRAKNASGSLLAIKSVSGDEGEIAKKLEPEEYTIRPLRILLKPPGKSEKVAATIILGHFQP